MQQIHFDAKRLWLFLGLALAACCSGCNRGETFTAPTTTPPVALPTSAENASPTTDDLPFQNVTEQTGIDFQFHSGRDAGEFAILESLGGGVAVFDLELDGNMDLMFAGGGGLQNQTVTAAACRLYRNTGDLRFVDITSQAGAAADRFYNHGLFPADFDNDGFSDLVVSGYGGLQFYRNQGDGTLQEQRDVGDLPDVTWATSIACGDFNGDGILDLYIPQYVSWSWDEHPQCFANSQGDREVCAPKDFRGLDDMLWLGDGTGRFRDATKTSGLIPGGKGLGAVAADLDFDGDTDIYVANDTTDNFLYMNDGQGVLSESAIIAGVSGDDVGVNTGSMGITTVDSDNDGRLDLWVTNFERELFALYRNDGAAAFTHVSRPAGLAVLGGLYVGFGTVAIDFDFDSDQDLVVANGHVSYRSQHSSFPQEALLLENRGDGTYQRVAAGGYFEESHVGRGLAYGDLDNDGAMELIFCNADEPIAILKADRPEADNFAVIRLIGTQSNRDAIGATIQWNGGGKRGALSRAGGGSYLSQSDPRILMTVPPDAVDIDVSVRWSSGHTETFPFPQDSRHVTWIEGTGNPLAQRP
ncbi:CRTAC1 family protein [Rosistilla oblonga]|uniref:CRTAC1 family protein n=1 Tax=Rosistilla oblonga TaxID=2527990 RepID=UPI003A972980